MIRLRGRRPSAEVKRFVRWLEDVLDVRHRVDVHLCGTLWGYFDAPGSVTGFEPYMVVLDDGKANVIDTIAHEMVHYEQWRDKRDITEKGVNQRARALVKRFRREAA